MKKKHPAYAGANGTLLSPDDILLVRYALGKSLEWMNSQIVFQENAVRSARGKGWEADYRKHLNVLREERRRYKILSDRLEPSHNEKPHT